MALRAAVPYYGKKFFLLFANNSAYVRRYILQRVEVIPVVDYTSSRLSLMICFFKRNIIRIVAAYLAVILIIWYFSTFSTLGTEMEEKFLQATLSNKLRFRIYCWRRLNPFCWFMRFYDTIHGYLRFARYWESLKRYFKNSNGVHKLQNLFGGNMERFFAHIAQMEMQMRSNEERMNALQKESTRLDLTTKNLFKGILDCFKVYSKAVSDGDVDNVVKNISLVFDKRKRTLHYARSHQRQLNNKHSMIHSYLLHLGRLRKQYALKESELLQQAAQLQVAFYESKTVFQEQMSLHGKSQLERSIKMNAAERNLVEYEQRLDRDGIQEYIRRLTQSLTSLNNSQHECHVQLQHHQKNFKQKLKRDGAMLLNQLSARMDLLEQRGSKETLKSHCISQLPLLQMLKTKVQEVMMTKGLEQRSDILDFKLHPYYLQQIKQLVFFAYRSDAKKLLQQFEVHVGNVLRHHLDSYVQQGLYRPDTFLQDRQFKYLMHDYFRGWVARNDALRKLYNSSSDRICMDQLNAKSRDLSADFVFGFRSLCSELWYISFVVHEVVELFHHDGVNFADYALHSSGGEVIGTRSTTPWIQTKSQITFFNIPIFTLTGSVRTVIEPIQQVGDCWAFKGSVGSVIIKLAHRIVITHVSVDHIAPSLVDPRLHGVAPNEFSVRAMKDLTTKQYTDLGIFRYRIFGMPLQTFQTIKHDTSFNLVEFRFHTNHGHVNFTCIYRLRVHGVRQQDV